MRFLVSKLGCFFLHLEAFQSDEHMAANLGVAVCAVGGGFRLTYSPWSSPLDSSEKADHCSWSRSAGGNLPI